MKYILWLNDCESEPYDWSDIRSMLEDESLSPDAFARQENSETWENVMTIWTESLRSDIREKRAELDLQKTTREANYHIPWCWKCQKHVQPQFVNRSQTSRGIGLAIPTQIGFLISQPETTTNELIKLCPNCGTRVISFEEMENSQRNERREAVEKQKKESIVIASIFVLLAIVITIGALVLLYNVEMENQIARAIIFIIPVVGLYFSMRNWINTKSEY